MHRLGGVLVNLYGCLGNESSPVHTFRHQAYGLRLGPLLSNEPVEGLDGVFKIVERLTALKF